MITFPKGFNSINEQTFVHFFFLDCGKGRIKRLHVGKNLFIFRDIYPDTLIIKLFVGLSHNVMDFM